MINKSSFARGTASDGVLARGLCVVDETMREHNAGSPDTIARNSPRNPTHTPCQLAMRSRTQAQLPLTTKAIEEEKGYSGPPP